MISMNGWSVADRRFRAGTCGGFLCEVLLEATERTLPAIRMLRRVIWPMMTLARL